MRRLVALLGITVALTGTLVMAADAPASAHAVLLQSNPSPGQVLTTSPSSVTLRFNESVQASLGSVRVFDAGGRRVDRGGVEQSDNTVRLPVPTLGDGSYVVTWRVTSADTHPVEGAFTFQVGTAANATSPQVTGLARRLLATQRGDTTVGVVYGVIRFLVFGALALLVGMVGAALLVTGTLRSSRRARRIVWWAWIGLFGATLLGLLVYGPYGAGLGLDKVFDPALIGDTLSERFGVVTMIRLGALLLAIPVLRSLFVTEVEMRIPRPLLWATAVLGVVVVATPGLAGHAVTGDWQLFAFPADLVHVAAMSLWLGGLVAVAAVLLPGPADELPTWLTRWSRLAFGCVVALVVTGAFQGWRQVGTLDALRDTDYGRLLIVKVVIFAVVLVFARMSHDRVLDILEPEEPELRAPDPVVHARVLRRAVWAEVAVAALVLGATALLVNAVPAKLAATQTNGGAAGITLKSNTVWVDVTFAPGRAGTNEVHVTALTPSGAPENVLDLTVTIDLPGRKIAPIDVPLRRLGPGHYLSPGFDVPFPGTWRVTAKPLVSQFEQPILVGTVVIE